MNFLKSVTSGVKSLWSGDEKSQEPYVPKEWPKITEEDFESLLEQERRGFEGWKKVKEEDLIKVYTNTAGEGVHPVRALFTLPGINPEVAFQVINQTSLRTQWDSFYVEYSILGKDDDLNEYLYQAAKGPATVTGRDFVLYRGNKVLEPGKVYVLVFKNAEHKDRPPSKKFIRAECIQSGYIIRPLPEDPSSCNMFVVSQNDVKGMLPAFLINLVAPRAVSNWHSNFLKACKRFGTVAMDLANMEEQNKLEVEEKAIGHQKSYAQFDQLFEEVDEEETEKQQASSTQSPQE